jgi:Zn-dependent protease with chaperone function
LPSIRFILRSGGSRPTDQVRFDAPVRTLEDRARRYPAVYRAQVAAVAALGYLYVLGLLFLLLVLVAGLVYAAAQVRGGAVVFFKLLVPVGDLGYVLFRSLWIRVPDLKGLPLPSERFPALAASIEKIRAQVEAPRFRRVLLDGNFNAGVAQRPSFGLVGPSVSDLVLGLPLMQAPPRAEFEAVLAHEMGHVSRQHGRFGHWIYRVRATWGRLSDTVNAGDSAGASLLLGRFLSWYAPFFSAYSFVLARLDEYEADQASVRVAGRDTVAAALTCIELLGRFHAERHWGEISRELNGGGTVRDPHAPFARLVAAPVDSNEMEHWLGDAVRRQTDHTDTHPCLADRLRAIGVAGSPPLPVPMHESAAATLLGRSADGLALELDHRWWADVEPRLT